jgi:23S rRNA (adenine2503-C2)-methyltransferase
MVSVCTIELAPTAGTVKAIRRIARGAYVLESCPEEGARNVAPGRCANRDGPRIMSGTKPDIRGMSLDEMGTLVESLGEPSYRAKQMAEWTYQRGARDFSEMTNLSKALRSSLAERAKLAVARVVESYRSEQDGTEKMLLEYGDGARIEAVLLRDGGRVTGCVSTQVGCRFGCAFCATGTMGFRRNLTAAEIVAEIIALREKAGPDRLNNLVFMGMGEPLDNYDEVLKAVRIANAGWGLGIGARRITISTAGLVPGILRLAEEGLQVRLAVSLNAPTQELREGLMPIAERYPLHRLVGAIERYSEATGRRASLEYVLLRDLNDGPEHADDLGKLARRLLCKVNLICYNQTTDSEYAPPADRTVEQFLARLRKRCPTVVRRVSRGGDISAACGQLCVPTGRAPRGEADGEAQR